MRVALALLACAAVAAGCGDEGDPAQTVREFVEATRTRDADTFCGRLVTQEFLEQTTGASGESAERACRRELRAVRGLSLRLVRIGRTEIDGDSARVHAVLVTEGRRERRSFELEREDGDWKLSGG